MIDLPAGNFLLPNATALVEAGVFLIVLFVVAKWVMPRLHATLDERRRLIDVELGTAADASEAAATHEQRAEEVLRQARREARVIIDRAYQLRDHLVAEGMRKGREEYDWFTRTRPETQPANDAGLVAAGSEATRRVGHAGSVAGPACQHSERL